MNFTHSLIFGTEEYITTTKPMAITYSPFEISDKNEPSAPTIQKKDRKKSKIFFVALLIVMKNYILWQTFIRIKMNE